MPWPRKLVAAGLGLAIAAAACAGGNSGDDPLTFAFKVTDDRRAFVEQTSAFADWLSDHAGFPVEVLTVQDDRAQVTALATGQADAAYMSGGPAWIAWSTFGLDAIVAEVREDGSTSYVAGLWVRSDSGIETIEDLRGRRSCHTGELAGTGMLVPMGYLIGNGYIDPSEVNMEDLAGLVAAREEFFSTSRIGGGYLGAFQCLSAGDGDMATGRSTAWDDFCGGQDPEPWCLPREAYRWLPPPDGPDPAVAGTGGLARVPSHPVMVSNELSPERRDLLRRALLEASESDEGGQILLEVLGAHGLVEASAADHLAAYGDVVRHVPGIQDAFAGQEP